MSIEGQTGNRRESREGEIKLVKRMQAADEADR